MSARNRSSARARARLPREVARSGRISSGNILGEYVSRITPWILHSDRIRCDVSANILGQYPRRICIMYHLGSSTAIASGATSDVRQSRSTRNRRPAVGDFAPNSPKKSPRPSGERRRRSPRGRRRLARAAPAGRCAEMTRDTAIRREMRRDGARCAKMARDIARWREIRRDDARCSEVMAL